MDSTPALENNPGAPGNRHALGEKPQGEAASGGKTIRGSALLLAGRVLALGLNLATQVIAVRFFSKVEYGALAYALSVVALGSTASLVGLDKAASRFMPIYREHGQQTKIIGALALMLWTIAIFGALMVAAVLGLHGAVSGSFEGDPLAASLLLILVILAPVGALDTLLVSLSAAFAGARAVFFRKHLLGPLLKLVATVVVVGAHGGIRELAWGMLAAGVLGTAIYVVTLGRLLRQKGLLRGWRGWRHQVPVREIFSFSFPMFGSDTVLFLRNSLVVILLQHFKDAAAVAAYQAVVPAGKLNLVVRESFVFLFVPAAARLHARGDERGVEELYGHTSMWVSLLSFPIFVVTFALATPITVLLFGERYADSGRILALLAFGQFFNAVAGMSFLTLRVLGKVRTIIVVDAIVTVLSLSLNLVLIPKYGAMGAAVATCATLVVHSVLNLAALYRASGISLVHAAYLRFFGGIALATGLLVAFQESLAPSLWVSLPFAAALIAVVGFVNRGLLDVAGTFPQLWRLPMVRRLFPDPKLR